MHTGRKILNLRCDRHISQQDLAKACDITPSALSKIEAGINSPRANIIWRIAQNLGVTVEYLLDEAMPYPYQGHAYRQEFLLNDMDPQKSVRMDVTLEERAFLTALRETNEIAREIALAIPEAPMEIVRLTHFLLNHSKIDNPSHTFLKSFESFVTTGEVPERKLPAKRKQRGRPARKAASKAKTKAKKKKRKVQKR